MSDDIMGVYGLGFAYEYGANCPAPSDARFEAAARRIRRSLALLAAVEALPSVHAAAVKAAEARIEQALALLDAVEGLPPVHPNDDPSGPQYGELVGLAFAAQAAARAEVKS